MDLRDHRHFEAIRETTHSDKVARQQLTARMALHRCAWIMTALCFAQVWALPRPCQLHGNLMKTTYNLLQAVGGHFPLKCLGENVDIALPKSAVEVKAQQGIGAAKAAYEMLLGINTLFENDGTPENWDATKLEDFQNIVYRQVEDAQCIMRAGQETPDDFSARQVAVRTFFEKLEALLKDKEYSPCAWEVVRKELLQALQLSLLHTSHNVYWYSTF